VTQSAEFATSLFRLLHQTHARRSDSMSGEHRRADHPH
jgi:hypothetical protein